MPWVSAVPAHEEMVRIKLPGAGPPGSSLGEWRAGMNKLLRIGRATGLAGNYYCACDVTNETSTLNVGKRVC